MRHTTHMQIKKTYTTILLLDYTSMAWTTQYIAKAARPIGMESKTERLLDGCKLDLSFKRRIQTCSSNILSIRGFF